MASYRVNKISSFQGECSVPGDKSISHRALMLGAMGEGRSTIRGLLEGEDVMATLRALQSLGVTITSPLAGEWVVEGVGRQGFRESSKVIDVGNSGTTIRLLTGLLSGQPFFTVLTGDASIRSRPMARVVDPLRQMGALIQGREDGKKAPLAVFGGGIRGIEYDSPVASAQVKSAILLAGINAEGVTGVQEPRRSRDHTERMMTYLGIPITSEDRVCRLPGECKFSGGQLEIPGDLSAAAFLITVALLTEGAELLLHDVGVNPTRTGVLDIFRMMGGSVEVMNQREISGEPVADLLVRHAPLHGIKIGGDLIPRTIDELPIVAVSAALADGETIIQDARELRVKETDRIAAMVKELKKLGATIRETEDGMVIQGVSRLNGGRCESWGDLRIAMSMAVAGLAAEGETVIEDITCVETSFPGFADTLREIGADILIEN